MVPIFLAAILATSTAGRSTPASSHYSCPDVKGLNLLHAPKGSGIHFVIVGELHGTVQQPRFFGDLVCKLSQEHALNIMLEFATRSTSTIQAYVASGGSAAAKRQLLSNAIWDPKYGDGRNSVAMFDLIERLRELKKAGANLQVYATQPDYLETPDQFYGELARADDWAKIAAAHADALNIILVGAAHAALNDNDNYGFLPAAAHLRPADVVAIGPTKEGGDQWSLDVSPTGQPQMGVYPIKGRPAYDDGIKATRDRASGWDATFSFGQPAKASPPARR